MNVMYNRLEVVLDKTDGEVFRVGEYRTDLFE
jgi:hypothetical protein